MATATTERTVVHQWREGTKGRIKCEPTKAYEEMKRARSRAKKRKEKFRSSHVVEVARSTRSPLHKEFIWDDAEAAHVQRCEHAKFLIRSLVVTVSEIEEGEVVTSQTVRQWTSLGSGQEDGKESEYHDTREVLSDAQMKTQVLLKIWRQLINLKRQYEDYKEFAAVWNAIDESFEPTTEVG